MFAIERRGLGYIEAAGGCVLRIVEPETDMKCVRRGQGYIGIEPEDLFQKDCLDADVTAIGVFSDLDVGLIPSQTEAAGEGGVGGPICLERASLHGEKIEGQFRFDTVEVQDQRVV